MITKHVVGAGKVSKRKAPLGGSFAGLEGKKGVSPTGRLKGPGGIGQIRLTVRTPKYRIKASRPSKAIVYSGQAAVDLMAG